MINNNNNNIKAGLYIILFYHVSVYIHMQAIVVSLLTEAGKQIIYDILNETYGLIKESIKNPKVNNIVEEMDLIADLKVVETLVNDVTVSEQKENVVDAVDMALINVKDTLLIIKGEMQTIQTELAAHELRFFANYREPNIAVNLENLAKHKAILDKRVDLLIKLLALKREGEVMAEVVGAEPHSTASTISSSTITFEFPLISRTTSESAVISKEMV